MKKNLLTAIFLSLVLSLFASSPPNIEGKYTADWGKLTITKLNGYSIKIELCNTHLKCPIGCIESIFKLNENAQYEGILEDYAGDDVWFWLTFEGNEVTVTGSKSDGEIANGEFCWYQGTLTKVE